MNPKILMAVDGSEESTKAVQYLADILGPRKDVSITVFHVTGIPPMLLEHGGADTPAKEKKKEKALTRQEEIWNKKDRKSVEERMFAPAKEILMEQVQGGKGRKIECKLVECPVHDLARSLIEEAKTGNYDTVVLGRHGRSRIVDYALGGLTSKIIHNLRGRTVWVVE